MYDTFPNFEEIEAQEFYFNASNLDLWQNKKIVMQASSLDIDVNSTVQNIHNRNRMLIVFSENLKSHIDNCVFDKIITSDDRLVMCTLPQENDYAPIQMLSQISGATRPPYDFKINEPYSCSMFLKNGQISKLTFNFHGTEKVIDLY